MHPACCRHCPGVGPAVAVEHWQRPQIAGLLIETQTSSIADCVQMRAAMGVNDAFGAARCARCVVQRQRLKFIVHTAKQVNFVNRPGKEI